MITYSINTNVQFVMCVQTKIMKTSLKNKVVVVTGGAQGIGCGIADQFLLHDAKAVILLDIDEVQGAITSKNLSKKHGEDKVEFIKCNVTTDLEQVSKTVCENYKTVDVLVVSAGVASSNNYKKLIDVNVTAVIEWSMKFLEHMRMDNGGNGGTIILISSIFGFRTVPYCPDYQASKFAVNGFTRSLGHVENFEKTKVRVVALCPGFTETRLTLNLRDPELKKTLPQDLVDFANNFPWQTIEDVGKAAVEMYAGAESGTVWLIEGGKQISQVL